MKKFLLLLPLLLIFSCSNKTKNEQVIEQKYPDDKPMLIAEYATVDGVRQKVKEVKYYADGKKEYIGNYKSDKKDGDWVYYHPNGNKWSEGNFINGLADGKRTVYYETGSKRYEGNFKEGIPVGKWIYWDPNGKVLSTKDYDKEPAGKEPATDIKP